MCYLLAMLGQFFSFSAQLPGRPPRNYRPALILSLMIGCVGCVQTKSIKPELTLQVQPAGSAGRYVASGQTTLPNQSRITIQAVRQLEPNPASRLTNQKPLYSILDRQQVEVTDGKWQATLNLLREKSGTALELWQSNGNPLGLAVQPNPDITFVAVSDTLNLPLDIKNKKDTNQPLESAVLQFSRDGSAYLQAKQNLTIAPPAIKTALVAKAPAVVQLKATPLSASASSTQKRQSDAPLLPTAYLR